MYKDRYVMVGHIRTHFLEAGSGEPLILIHSGEYGASAQNSWAYNIEALSRHFHVLAPDLLGFGYTDKLHSFDDMRSYRINHIRDFMRTLCIEEASFIGNSMGASLVLEGNAHDEPMLRARKIIAISGGGANVPEVLAVLGNYDGSAVYMKQVHEILFHNMRFRTNEYVARRVETSLIPGSYEALSAARLRSPAAAKKALVIPDFSKVKGPVLVCAGRHDSLKPADYTDFMRSTIPHCKIQWFEQSAHCAHMDEHELFNQTAIDFLVDH